ncbi:MAG: PEP-CTERM sorting domain-containing protein [Acidobacteria bacterium]|nr:PEP-CTERM sorting domain-containing protein [Acidobacteriota bacterium]
MEVLTPVLRCLPESATLLLLGAGLALIALRSRRLYSR